MRNDDELIEACRRDPAAFRALVERYQGRLYAFLTRLAGREAADDLFQEVWLKVYRNADRYDARGKAASWLFKIANNAAFDRLARRGKEGGVVESGVDIEGFADRSPGPTAILEEAEGRGRIDAAIARLPPEQRQVFLLREHGGLSFKEIAAALGIPLGTALSRMNAALEKLRAALEDRHAS